MKTKLLLLIGIFVQLFASAQVTLVDFVRIKNNRHKEALYFYQNNWKLYREEAIKRGAIQSYQLLSVPADSAAAFHLMLLTVYKDSAQYLASEAAFEPIIKALRPAGPALLNELKPADFRENLFYKAGTTVFAGEENDVAEMRESKEGSTAIYTDSELIITQNGNYFMPGQKFEMSVIAQNENTFKVASVSIGGKKQVWRSGHVLTYELPVSTPGSHEIPVVVSFRNSKGQLKRKRYKATFDVGMPTAAIGLDRMNILYIGIDNPISVATSFGGEERVMVSISGGGGRLAKVGTGSYNIHVNKIEDCTITVSVDGKVAGSYKYKIRHLPVPLGTVGGYTAGDSVAVSAFLAQQGVGAYLKDFPFEIHYEVLGYNLNIQSEKGVIKSVNCESAYFSPEAKQLMKDYLRPRAIVTIGNIFAKGPDGRTLKLSPLVYHIK